MPWWLMTDLVLFQISSSGKSLSTNITWKIPSRTVNNHVSTKVSLIGELFMTLWALVRALHDLVDFYQMRAQSFMVLECSPAKVANKGLAFALMHFPTMMGQFRCCKKPFPTTICTLTQEIILIWEMG